MNAKNSPILPYNIANVGENDAEINLYGEVVETRPVDWWTGQPVEGSFIAVDEFLQDLEALSSKENITVHINSVGGSLYGGIAIYNRLKALPAKITTVNDGLAASAGSIIFQAGDVRRVNTGSNVMIHGAMGFLYGYYQVKGLKAAQKQLEAGNKAAINIYTQATGRDSAAIQALVEQETWLTGEEAVAQGFADEVVGEVSGVSMSLSPDKKFITVNGISLPTFGMSNIPKRIPISNRVLPQQGCGMGNDNTGGTNMEITNMEELRTAYPELVAQLEAAAQTAGAAAERARIQSIEAIQGAVADKALVEAAKYGETPSTAEQLAFQAMQQQAALGANMLGSLTRDAQASGAAAVAAAPNAGTEPTAQEQAKAQEEAAVAMIVGSRAKKEAK